MKVRMDFTDGATDFFNEFQKVSFGLVKEGLSRASSQLAKQYRTEIKKEAPSEWSSYEGRHKKGESGKRRLSVQKHHRKKEFGQKHSKKDGNILKNNYGNANIADHVNFYTPKGLYDLYAVVGGGHPTFRPIKYVDGIPKGHLKRITATTQDTLEILDRLNDGETRPLTRKERSFLAYTNGLETKTPKMIHIKPRRFAEKARAKGASAALAKVRNLYESNFNRATANINVKQTKIAV